MSITGEKYIKLTNKSGLNNTHQYTLGLNTNEFFNIKNDCGNGMFSQI